MKTNAVSLRKSSFKGSLRAKFIASFAIVTLLLSTISIVTYMTMKSTINKLDDMVQTTIQTNSIATISQDILDKQFTSYMMDKSPENKKKIIDEYALMKTNLDKLKKNVLDDKSVLALYSLTKLTETNIENGREILKDFEDDQKLSEGMLLKDKQFKLQGFLKSAQDELISCELKLYQVKKEELNKNANFTGIVILILIPICGLLSILFAVIFSNYIAGMISKLAQYAQSISDGNLMLNKVEVKTNDDISASLHASTMYSGTS